MEVLYHKVIISAHPVLLGINFSIGMLSRESSSSVIGLHICSYLQVYISQHSYSCRQSGYLQSLCFLNTFLVEYVSTGTNSIPDDVLLASKVLYKAKEIRLRAMSVIYRPMETSHVLHLRLREKGTTKPVCRKQTIIPSCSACTSMSSAT